jgi:hypothetical protein
VESRRRTFLIALLVLSAVAAPAFALEDDVRGQTTSRGVDVIISAHDEASNHVPAGHSLSSCHWTAIPYYDENTPPPTPRPGPDFNAYLVYCDGDFVSISWLGPRNFGAPDTVGMAGQVVDNVPVDLATIEARPAGRAITGIPSYFWVGGYTGAPIDQTVSAFGVDVAVTITLGTVTWDFGDGTPAVTAGLGEAWPARSSVHHTYRDKGDRTVTVTLTLPAHFSVNGGPPQALPPVVRTATLAYAVDEVQAVRDR